MNAKQRIKQLEKAQAKTGGRCVVWLEDEHGDGIDSFDGVKMPHAEAEAKAAAMPESVLLIRVEYVDAQGEDHDNK